MSFLTQMQHSVQKFLLSMKTFRFFFLCKNSSLYFYFSDSNCTLHSGAGSLQTPDCYRASPQGQQTLPQHIPSVLRAGERA